MARRKLLKTVPARQGDRSRRSLMVLAISLPVAIAAMIVIYYFFFT